MKRTAEEITGRICGELKRAAEGEAQRRADAQAKIDRARWAARGVVVPENVQKTDGLREWRDEGFVGNALMHGPGVIPVDPWEKVVAGWEWERVKEVAGVESFPDDERGFATHAAWLAWREARARVAIQDYLGAESAALWGAEWHEGGERRATSRTDYADEMRRKCTAVFLEETENWVLKMGKTVDEMDEKTDLLLAVATGLADKEARADALVLAFKRFCAEVGAGTPPGGKVALAHYQNFILDARNKAALGRVKKWRTFRLKYGEWLGLGMPKTGKEYLEKQNVAKRQKRKTKRAGG